MELREMTRLIYDKLMDNDQHTMFSVSEVDDCELSGRFITFTYKGVPFVITIDVN